MKRLARKAREKKTYGTYLITQNGGGCRSLFTNQADREKFLFILKKAKKKFDFKLFSYCLAKDDQYQLVLFDNGCDVSNIMRSINISYAMYAKCDGKLFRDRYVSTLIEDYPALLETTRTIHHAGQQSDWNSWCVFNTREDSDLIDDALLLGGLTGIVADAKAEYKKMVLEPSADAPECNRDQTFCEDETQCMRTEAQARERLVKEAEQLGMSVSDVLHDKSVRNAFIKMFRKHSTLSMRTLGQIFGGLSESAVCRILSRE